MNADDLTKDFWKGYQSTPETRKEMLSLLSAVWEKHPHLRFGQLICTVEASVPKIEPYQKTDLFDIWDEDLIKYLKAVS